MADDTNFNPGPNIQGSPAGRNLAKDPYPTAEYIDQLIYRARFEFSREDMRDRIRDSVFWGDNEVPHPAHIDHQEVHMMSVNKAVQDIIGLLSNRPKAKVGETSLNTKKVTRATSVENFLNALYPALERDIDELTWLKILEDQTRFGRAYDCLEYVPSRWAKQPRLKNYTNPDGTTSVEKFKTAREKYALEARIPLVWRHLPARGCFCWKDDNGIQQFLSIEERSAYDVAQSYGMPELLDELDDMARTPSQHVIFCRYWNRSYYAYWISTGFSSQTWEQRAQAGLSLLTLAGSHQGKIAAVGKNIYGVVPVIESKALSSTDQNPARMHVAPIDAMIPLAIYLDQLVSQKGSAIRVYAWPTPYIKNVQKELGASMQTVPVGPDGRPSPLNIEPGKVLYLPTGQDIGWLVVPQNGPDIDKQIALVQQQTGSVSIPSALFDGSSQANGYLYNSMMQAVIGKLAPQVMHTKLAHAKRNELAFRILEIHGEDLYIFQPGSDASDYGNWTNVGPKDIIDWKSRYNIDTDYEDEHPYDEAADIAAAMQLSTDRGNGQGPLLSDDTVRTVYLHLPDPSREAEKIRIQEVEKSQIVSEFLQTQATIDAGIQLDKIQNQMQRLTPDQLRMLPPSLVQAFQTAGQPIAGGQPPNQSAGAPFGASQGTPATPTAGTGAGVLAAPSTMGGVPGAPAAPVVRGLTHPLTPAGARVSTPPPARKTHNQRNNGAQGFSGINAGGRAKGQAKRPESRETSQ